MSTRIATLIAATASLCLSGYLIVENAQQQRAIEALIADSAQSLEIETALVNYVGEVERRLVALESDIEKCKEQGDIVQAMERANRTAWKIAAEYIR